MSRLAVNWVEANFDLEKPVVNIEKEFSNGYIFVDMLAQRQLFNEDDIAKCKNSDLPKDIIQNMKLLTRGLKKLDVVLNKSQVADITSEQPGGATELIMRLKRAFEGSTAPSYANAGFRKATQSLKPRTFVRNITKQEGYSEEEVFFMNNLAKKANHKFRDVDAIIQTDHYHKFDTLQDKQYVERMNSQLMSYEQASADRRVKILDNINSRIQKREETFQTGQQKWSTNQQSKKDRKTRDLQFELALGAKRSLSIQNNHKRHQVDQEEGIDSFETNMKRNGIGGDVEEGSSLLPTSEDSTIFMHRLELNATRDWPTDGEVGDFMQVLERRTKELRVARAEKARRKRRMLVDQDAALVAMEDQQGTEEEESLLTTLSAQEVRAAHKQQDFEARTAAAKTQHAARVEEGEAKMREFCEKMRMRAFDEDGLSDKVRTTLEAQAKRKVEKKERNHEMCKLLVQQLVNELFATGANAQDLHSKSGGGPKYVENISKAQLITELLDTALQPPPADENEHPLTKRAISSRAADLWISAVNLANNVGKWKSLAIDSPIPFDITTADFGRLSSFSENAVKTLSELVQFLKADGLCPFSIDASEPFHEHGQLMVIAEALAREQQGQEQEQSVVPPRPQQVCMVLGEKHDISGQAWSLAVDWMGGEDNVHCWSTEQAVTFAFSLHAAATPEGKDAPQDEKVTFSLLCEMFGVLPEVLVRKGEGLEVEGVAATLAGVSMVFQPASIVSEVISVVSRMKEACSLFPDDNSVPSLSSLEVSSFEFNDATLIILAAQLLWLRDYVSRQLHELFKVQPFTQHVLFLSSRGAACDRWEYVPLVDYFLKGGSRQHIPEHLEVVAKEVTEELSTVKPKKGKAAPPKKKDKKDKSEPVVFEESMVCSVVWIHTPPLPILREEVQEGAENSSEDEVRAEESDTKQESDITEEEKEPKEPEDDGTAELVEMYDEELSLPSKLLSLSRRVWEASVSDEDKAARALSPLGGLKTFSSSESCPVHYFTLGEGSMDDDYSNFVIFNDFCALESLLCIFLVDALGQGQQEEGSAIVNPESAVSQGENEGAPTDVSLSSHARVLSLAAERKQSLGFAQKMWRAITMKELTLNTEDVLSVLMGCRRQNLVSEEHLGSLVLVALLKLESVHKELLFEKAKVTECMKSEDEGWKRNCLIFHEQLQTMARSHPRASHIEMQAMFSDSVRELNCEQGDIIDARHLEWLKLVEMQAGNFGEIVNDMTATTLDISYCFRETFAALLKKKIAASLSIASVVFDESGDCPWPLKTAFLPANTVEDVQRSITEQVDLLHKQFISAGGSSTLESDFSIEKWSEMFLDLDSFIADAVSSSSESFTSAVIEEVRYEALMSFFCLVKSFNACLGSLKETKDNIVEDLNGYVLSRNSYEHQMLQNWIAELYQTRQNKNSEDPLSAPMQFLSSYFFGLSDDPELDGVPHSSLLHLGLVQVQDMRVDSKMLRELTYYIVKVRQECEFENLSVFDTLKAIVTKAIESDLALPASWRSIKRLRALYESVLTSSQDYSLSENSDVFFQHLVMKLVLGFLEHAPTSVYVAKLGLKILTNTEDLSKSVFLSSSEEQIVDLSRITAAIRQDKVLKLGWWNTDVKPAALKAHTATLIDVIESVALMCCTSMTPISFNPGDNCIETAYVRFDTFVLLLTMNFCPVNDDLKVFQRVLCTPSTEEVDRPSTGKKSLKREIFPNFVDEGLTKLTNVASSLVEAAGNDGFSASDGGDALRAFEEQLYGPVISEPKKKWLTKHLKLADGTIGPDCPTAGSLFRKTQKKQNFSFII